MNINNTTQSATQLELKKSSASRIMNAWLILMLLTLMSAFIAEQAEPTAWIVVIICTTICIKGAIVIERFMGLNVATPAIRWMMLSYVLVMVPIVALSVIFPDVLARLTAL